MSGNIKNKKIAVILFNLGGPDNLQAVKPFLFNLFNDKYIITLPSFFRKIIAWIISSKREKTAQEIYSYTGGKSPILEQTEQQRKSLKLTLKDKINSDFEIYTCMRHWHPMSEEVINKISKYNPDEIILLPLYPQFSTTTSLSSIEDFISGLNKSVLKNKIVKTVCCYPFDNGFIDSHVELIRQGLDKLKNRNNYRILFSAHGLPEKIVKSGDPYQWQVEGAVERIVKKLDIDDIDYKVTYQSRVGPLEWLKPDTEEEIKIAGKDGIALIIVPVAFVSEHVETLVELDIEYKKIADNYKIEYIRVPALGINDSFIKMLTELVVKFSKNDGNLICSSDFGRICPQNFTKCPCKEE